MYSAYILPDHVREKLLEIFPTKYPDVIAHHVTEHFGISSDDPISDQLSDIEIYCEVYDPINHVQALIVRVDGKSLNSNGKVYHITWSIDRSTGAKPVMSNNVIMSVHGCDSKEWHGIPVDHKTIVRINEKIGLTVCR